jgi:hypothetical protein
MEHDEDVGQFQTYGLHVRIYTFCCKALHTWYLPLFAPKNAWFSY